MARIKDTSVRDAVAAADIVEVVSQRTALRKSGARYTGRCPFHDERTPSFSVNAVDKLYYCFGCGAKGDVITFVRETESLDFVGAIEWLADRFRVQLEYEETSPAAESAKQRRDRLYQALEQAAAFFERHLWDSDAGAPVREYLASRGLGEEISKEFRLGLSPGRGLAAKARSVGFTPEELQAAGLANQRGNDYFPFRLMFPLADARGRVIGFQARRLRDDDPLRGKYVNSPEGELFKKSNVLYGLHLARAAIAKQDRALIVEGNTDAIALRQAELEPVVAAMGTALTEGHLRELDRLTRRLFLCFDADAAGQDATLRGMELAVQKGFDVRVVTLSTGQDPADAPKGFEQRLEGAESYLRYRTRIAIEREPDRGRAFADVQIILREHPSSPERDEALALVQDMLGLPRETLARLIPPKGQVVTTDVQVSDRLATGGDRLEKNALAACLAHPGLRRQLEALSADHFDSELHRRFREVLVADAAEDAELVALKAELDARAHRDALDERTGQELLLQLRERALRRQLEGADLARTTELQAHLVRVHQALTELR